MQIAAVATARTLAVLCWHLIIKGEDYAFAQSSLVAHKRRKLELRAGHAYHQAITGWSRATGRRPSREIAVPVDPFAEIGRVLL